ncbi:LysR family transcriptional regulator [Chromatocurvus halotolerans]|uniref:LysR family transcriptional regulator n=1 Tax=Chromatocurvus halotolerans TaxID=1132028 RepID=A0A4R2L8X0_9GAMM|nr:LysR family transcriptional regulator [Chromatocurvus halotolerans]TCO75665.1 LysR family transcriptional regulator [Chromatocurvus halotolerans]
MSADLDLHNLRAFRAIAETGSFSAAAMRLHLSQPAISKRIALLEAHLGVTLFDRVGRRVLLTEAGSALLPHATAIELSFAAAEQAVRDLDGEVSGRLHLGTSHHIGLHRLPPILSAFTRAYPDVRLDIQFLDSEQAYAALAAGDIELAIATLAPQDSRQLASHALWQDPLDFMVAADHPLASSSETTLMALSNHAAVLPGLETFTGQRVSRCFDAAELQLQVAMSTNYLETLRMMAAVGLGWTVLPRRMQDRSLRCLAVKGVQLERTLGYAIHRQRSPSRAASALIEALRRAGDGAIRH